MAKTPRLFCLLSLLLALGLSGSLVAQDLTPTDDVGVEEPTPASDAPVDGEAADAPPDAGAAEAPPPEEDSAADESPPEEDGVTEEPPPAGDTASEEPLDFDGRLAAHTQPNRLEDATIIHSLMWSGRMVTVPDFILDIWFARHGSHWQGQSNFAFGLEYDLRFVDLLDLNFGVYYTDLTMPNQYWLEEGENFASADFMRQGLSVLSFEVNVYGFYDFIPELGIYYGGGLWGGAFVGKLDKANVDVECADAAEQGQGSLDNCAHDRTFADEEGIPPLLGFVNAAFGLRAVLAERFVMKLEGGFRGYFYGGFSMGAQFY